MAEFVNHISLDRRPSKTTIALFGEFDAPDGWRLRDLVLPLLAEPHPVVEVDLSGVTFAGSATLGVLLQLRAAAAAAGGELRVVAASAMIARLLELTGLAQVLGLSATSGAD
jgi:anti-sigma B factor antagonist